MRRSMRPGTVPHGDHEVPPPGNLPTELNRFVGRRAELAELGRQLDRSRLVTVTGVGGVGKSRFALRAAHQAQERFFDGVWLVELATLRDPDLLEHAFAEALALADRAGRARRAALAEQLADRQLLLVLDGFEHVVEECAGLVRELLCRGPGLRVLAAGRRPLRVPGEQAFPLPPLPAPAPARAPQSPPPRAGDSAVLFADRAAAVLPGFAVNESNCWEVAELCHRLEGIPLALELAAGRLPALSLEQLLHRLDDRFRLLTGGNRGTLPRHRTLRTAIGWSHELCTPQERLLWARLSVFAGQFDLEAAEYVCSGPDLPADDLLDVVAELVSQSLLVREETPAGPPSAEGGQGRTVRYRMLETVRAYGACWLDATGDTARMRRRHRDWYMGLATWCELDWFSPRQSEVAARIDAELSNIRCALEFSLERGEDAHTGQYLAGTLWFYWVGCGRLAEGRHWLDRVLELENRHAESRLKALWVAGYVALLQGDTAGAVAALQECSEEAERTGNPLAAAYALHRTGCLALVSDDMPRAEELLRSALGQYREIGELNSNVLMGQVELAMVVAFRGDPAGAIELCEEVRSVCEEHGERWTLAYALYVLGYAAWSRGEAAEARKLLEECLAIDRGFHDPVGSVLALELLALITAGEGDAEEAAVLQGAAGRLWPSAGPRLFGSQHFNAPRLQCERQAREALGAERYEECLRAGARLDLEAAAARALRGTTGQTAQVPAPRGEPQAALPPSTHEPAGSPSASGGETAG
ncbi:tetratricopeptide repeat protein [Streptomyces sp. NPDC004647]|uniref:ATP-binding protein n=1 Tax=Streptomyces sp. NPDC004647 TaxID=3154671 RepID=UPI00339DBBFD